MDLCNINTVNKILAENGFSFSKKLGQNFIVNPAVCPKMAAALGAGEKTGVLEIGPGIGTLTQELCKCAGKVVSVEADRRLISILNETLGARDNLKIICADFLKLDLAQLVKDEFAGMSCIKVCANLPYYITTPIISALLKSGVFFESIVLMLQKETAQRITADIPGRGSSAITVMVNYYADAQLLFQVGRGSFVPAPQVDSAVIRLNMRKNTLFEPGGEAAFFRVVNAAFSQRRKNITNSLSSNLNLPKDKTAALLSQLQINPLARAEDLSMGEFALISQNL
ncbi:MAG: 16S rRNA (adenine(1518)-N(6)/adenine(1519)-N(6))-dimethyltransferase RsmA [Clostridiales bacterium]|nr:16S rRNA (adenine(1518)-N(6)/adenine(1519)-N(6))-dimethyltransferase RsmA [Clostridiales bacterium]